MYRVHTEPDDLSAESEAGFGGRDGYLSGQGLSLLPGEFLSGRPCRTARGILEQVQRAAGADGAGKETVSFELCEKLFDPVKQTSGSLPERNGIDAEGGA